MAQERATIRDVARLAGVSRQTVSRVSNAPETVSPGTRHRVEQAIRALDYRPNPVARALKTTRTGTIGVMASAGSWYGLYGMPVFTRAAQTHGYGVVATAFFQDSYDEARTVATRLLDHGVDGLLVMSPQAFTADYVYRLAARIPLVVVQDEASEHTDAGCIGIDQADAVRQVVDHLVATGHRTMAHLPGPRHWTSGRLRAEAWRALLEERGLEVRFTNEGNYRSDTGYALGKAQVRRGVPEAMFVANDLMALGFIRAMVDAGVRVPHDVSVVGFDDIAGGQYLVPALSTVRQPFDPLCARAVEMLVEQIGGGTPVHEQLTAELLVRETVADRRTDREPE